MNLKTFRELLDALTSHDFATFLHATPLGRNCYPNDFRCTTCPLARFLRTVDPSHKYFVNRVVGIFRDDGTALVEWPLPQWMRTVRDVSDSLRVSDPDATYETLLTTLQFQGD